MSDSRKKAGSDMEKAYSAAEQEALRRFSLERAQMSEQIFFWFYSSLLVSPLFLFSFFSRRDSYSAFILLAFSFFAFFKGAMLLINRTVLDMQIFRLEIDAEDVLFQTMREPNRRFRVGISKVRPFDVSSLNFWSDDAVWSPAVVLLFDVDGKKRKLLIPHTHPDFYKIRN